MADGCNWNCENLNWAQNLPEAPASSTHWATAWILPLWCPAQPHWLMNQCLNILSSMAHFFSIFCWCLVWITYVKMRLTYWHLPLLLNLNLSDFWCLLYLFYKFGSPTIQFINIYSNHISSTSCRGLLYLFCLSWSHSVFSFPLLGSLISMGDCVWGTFLGDHR